MKYLNCFYKCKALLRLSLSNSTKLTTCRCISFSSSLSDQSRFSMPRNPFVELPPSPRRGRRGSDWVPPLPPPHQLLSSPTSDLNAKPNYSLDDFSTLCNLLRDPNLRPGPSLEAALDQTGIQPELSLLRALFDSFDSSPKLLYALFLWAEKKPGFQSSATLFNSVINVLGKAREFDSAWYLVLDCIGGEKETDLVSSDTFAILIRRYARAGMPQPAIRTFEYVTSSSNCICNSDAEMSLLEILLDSLCKEGQVRVAKEYFERKKQLDPGWVPSVRIYNILLNGWFRSRKLKHAEKLWLKMKEENVKPSIVTYGTLVEGFCRMRRVEMAIDLVDAMRREGIERNAIVYNPIIDALAEAGRFKEVSGMMEYFLQSESGPTISTYNSLVKGYCKAGDLIGASNIIKMMITRGFVPTPTTYNYFFRHLSKFEKIDEGMNLYTKMIECGYTPDRLTYHLLLKMLCEQERLDLAVQISKEMRARGCDTDLATSTMFIHLLCRAHRFEEAVMEFEDMLRKGIVPQYLTFHRLYDELMKRGMAEIARKLSSMMSSVSHSTNLPNTFSVEGDASRRARRTSILQKAEAMSKILKTCNDPRELVKRRSSTKNPVSSANQLMDDIKKRTSKT